jgi:uncharacterized protein (TIGR03435 family)
MNRVLAVAALVLLELPWLAAQQQTSRTFDVVSIRRSTNPDTDNGWGTRPGGRWVLVNASIMVLVRAAYPTDSSEYIGGPDWLRNDRYDLTAVGPEGTTRAEIEPMLRALLAERFDFKGHYETREQPVYHLVLARQDGKLPSALRSVDVDCDARREATVRGEKVPELPRVANGMPPCAIGLSYADGVTLRSGGRTMNEFAQATLTSLAERVVVDRTGLQGRYEFDMKFSANPQQADSSLSSLFTALQEQLGLKLEPARGSVRVFVIDQIERPSEN